MPLWRYVKKGVAFSPEEMAIMGEAFAAAIADLGIAPEDESRREAVAQFILDFVRADSKRIGGLISADRIRSATVKALADFAKRGGG